ncbi:unnamed protein product [Ceratitis capitata]|uniref:(Mediterranean fruit fly) hypothetical protein n=1 Tax=Ceratitis capitata TaxID=7213 RepID=A0A811UNQ5_CERCA|nr:unnamed protein product [Ceratitis capitata]
MQRKSQKWVVSRRRWGRGRRIARKYDKYLARVAAQQSCAESTIVAQGLVLSAEASWHQRARKLIGVWHAAEQTLDCSVARLITIGWCGRQIE